MLLLSARNRKDLEDVPDDAQRQLTFVRLETVDDAMRPPCGAGVHPLHKGSRRAWRHHGKNHIECS
jgi:hypothetical protein